MIEKLDKNLFDFCSSLQYINFNDKNLRELDKNLFSGCKEALKAINFENNEIGDLSSVLFLRFKNLESIKFKNIPIFNHSFYAGCRKPSSLKIP